MWRAALRDVVMTENEISEDMPSGPGFSVLSAQVQKRRSGLLHRLDAYLGNAVRDSGAACIGARWQRILRLKYLVRGAPRTEFRRRVSIGVIT